MTISASRAYFLFSFSCTLNDCTLNFLTYMHAYGLPAFESFLSQKNGIFTKNFSFLKRSIFFNLISYLGSELKAIKSACDDVACGAMP